MIRIAGGGSFQLSTTEQVYPSQLHPDGSTLYCKYVNFGAIPNATTKTIAHGLTNYSMYRFEAFLHASDGSLVPFTGVDVSLNTVTWARFWCTPTHISVTTAHDYSWLEVPYVELYYKKV